jgi:hypothetical protein
MLSDAVANGVSSTLHASDFRNALDAGKALDSARGLRSEAIALQHPGVLARPRRLLIKMIVAIYIRESNNPLRG